MPLNLQSTRSLLQSLQHDPRKLLGQNFLVDGNIVRKSIAMADLKVGETVVEIGPGLGTLTRELLASGVKVYAVELDKTLQAHLRETLVEEYPGQFQLFAGDAVRHPLAMIAPNSECKVVANLPYAISTPWMEAVLNQATLPKKMVLMLQKEAADRLLALPGSKHCGAVSILLRSAYATGERHPVAASCFHPPPRVESCLITLDRLASPIRFPLVARQAMRAAFIYRRKQLLALCRKDPAVAVLQHWLEDCIADGLDPQIRAEAIPLARWQALPGYLEGTDC
jgi:16S rRNA (adenine1518-N6/adenine1519-N6)-dimethyltransferase